ncbi:hypothetical protein HAX54_018760, partial [Datura stramonium]|nr:hypothetical protein [Datura stramonium]
MEQRLTIDAITPLISEWTCKIQVIDKFHPRESKDQAVHFQTIIVQDENEEQVCIILYCDDIGRCHKLFQLFDTYLISTAKVREPRGYQYESIDLNGLLIVIYSKKKPVMFTMWDDLADNEGATLLRQLHEHPVILAKRIGFTEYRG